MKELIYFGVEVESSETKTHPNFEQHKLYSEKKLLIESPEYLENILYFKEEFAANIKLPQQEITFYQFNTWEESSQLDDFMSSIEINPSFGFFVSPKAKNILSEFNVFSNKYFPVNIKHADETYPYYFLLIAKESQPITYNESIYFDWLEDQPIKINSLMDTLEENDEIDDSTFRNMKYLKKDIEEKKIVFSTHVAIYSSFQANYWFYFSEQLKKRLEEEGISGIQFYPAEKPEFYLSE